MFKTLWNGFILVTVKNRSNSIIKRKDIIKNTITNSALDEMIKGLYGSVPNIKIEQLALGTGTNAPSASNTTLQTETYRISDTALGRSNIGEVTSEFVLTGTEYLAVVPSGVINEIGIFGGTGALTYSGGVGIDTGTLIARVLWSYTIASVDEDIYFQRIDTIGG